MRTLVGCIVGDHRQLTCMVVMGVGLFYLWQRRRRLYAPSSPVQSASPPTTGSDQTGQIKHTMLVRTQGGLANRLRVLLSYREVARDQGVTLECYWPIEDCCPASFDSLFEPLVGVTVVDAAAAGCVPGRMMSHRSIKGTEREASMYLGLQPKEPINQTIKDSIERCGALFVAVHIRRTDLADQVGTDDNEFVRFIDTALANGSCCVWVATDNASTQAALAARYGDRFRSHGLIQHSASRLRQTSVADALVDLHVCTKATVFKGTRGSSFSETIWMMRMAHGCAHDRDELFTGRQLRRRAWRRNRQQAAQQPHVQQSTLRHQ